MKVKYVGPFDEVEIPSLGVVVKNGDEIEVEAGIANGLLEQSENFKKSASKSDKSAQEN